MTIFEQASKTKLRFATSKGNLSTEDLWDLPLDSARNLSLTKIAKSLQSTIAEQSPAALDFLDVSDDIDPDLQLRMDIVKHIYLAKVAENKAKSEAKANDTHNRQILELIAKKQTEELANKSVEELQAMMK